MNGNDWLAQRFQANRPHLRAVAYRILGSVTEAEDAVQETWLRLSRTDTSDVANLGGWLTTVVGRISLDMLRSRGSRREEPLDYYVPDPIVEPADGSNPEHQALLADSVGLALLVVLETLTPAERLAFVLHDMFAMPFDEIAPILDRTPAAAKMLASRARRRVQGAGPGPDPDLARQRQVVDAFIAASHGGDLNALLAVLDPDVVLRADTGEAAQAASRVLRGSAAVAGQAMVFARLAPTARPAMVNGAAGAISAQDGQVQAVLGFTISGGRIVEINILADPARLQQLDLAFLGN